MAHSFPRSMRLPRSPPDLRDRALPRAGPLDVLGRTSCWRWRCEGREPHCAARARRAPAARTRIDRAARPPLPAPRADRGAADTLLRSRPATRRRGCPRGDHAPARHRPTTARLRIRDEPTARPHRQGHRSCATPRRPDRRRVHARRSRSCRALAWHRRTVEHPPRGRRPRKRRTGKQCAGLVVDPLDRDQLGIGPNRLRQLFGPGRLACRDGQARDAQGVASLELAQRFGDGGVLDRSRHGVRARTAG